MKKLLLAFGGVFAGVVLAVGVLLAEAGKGVPPGNGQDIDRLQLARDVDVLLRGDQVLLRRNVDKVFLLAGIRESEGRSADAIFLYENALQVNAANISGQMKLAELLARNGRTGDAEVRAKVVQRMAEHEELAAAAEDLLKSLGKPVSAEASLAREAGNGPVQIVLVPMGSVNRRVLASLRDKLEEKMEVEFAVSPQREPGKPDRTLKNVYVRDVYETLRKQAGEAGAGSLLRELGLSEDALRRPDAQLKFIHAVFQRVSTLGLPAKTEFEREMAKADQQFQFDAGRLLREMQAAFPLDPQSRVKGYLAVTDEDLFEGESRFRFGGALPGHGVISLRRFTSDFTQEDQNRPRLVQRTLKQALSSANFILGIPRCGNPDCARAYPNSLQELDQKPDVLCPLCRERLAASAWEKA